MMGVLQRANFSLGFILKVQLYALNAHIAATCRNGGSMTKQEKSQQVLYVQTVIQPTPAIKLITSNDI